MRNEKRFVAVVAALTLAGGMLWAAPVGAQCSCSSEICTTDGFEKKLATFSVDPIAGTSSWTYEVCNQAKGKKVCSSNKCSGGTLDGKACTTEDCPGAQCVDGLCNGGSKEGQVCVNNDCPGGTCVAGGGGGGGAIGDDCLTDADCQGVCVPCAPRHDLSHVDIVLPGLGECVTDMQQISVQQLGCPACNPLLTCSISDRDPSCPAQLCAPNSGGKFCQVDDPPGNPKCDGAVTGPACTNSNQCPTGSSCCEVTCQAISNPVPLKVLKCNVADGSNLDPGECVQVQVTIAGENPTVGPGTIDEVTKAADACTTERLCGPACNCALPPEACLTRTAGFWGNHPAITSQLLPITVCGNTFTSVDAATNTATCKASTTEALCAAPGVEANRTCDKNPAYQQLVRQLAAAKLNLKATAANNGNCGSDIATVIAGCELLCGASQPRISSSGCIQQLDAFNNSQDTFAMTPPPFDNPGPADPTQCKAASGNGWVSGKKCGLNFDCKP
jgi:hypothetical protein